MTLAIDMTMPRRSPGLGTLIRQLIDSGAIQHDNDSMSHAALERRFMEVVRQHESTISALCFSYVSSLAQYDDLRQDALVNIWRGLPGYRGESSMRTWIYRVVLNSCVSTVRRESRHSRESQSLDSLYDIIDEGPADRSRVEALHYLIGTLGAEDRAIILMWLDEASYDDIAEVMGMARNTVATRLRRIKTRLTEKMKNLKL